MADAVQCDMCSYYDYDEEADAYVCAVNMDEDDFMRLLSDSHAACPYFNSNDDYRLVRRQN